MLENRKTIYDVEAELKDAGLVASSGVGSVDGVKVTYDTGGGFTEGKVVFDITAIHFSSAATAVPKYHLVLQGSSTSTFTSYVNLASVALATASESARYGANVTVKATGIYFKPFTNQYGGTIYRWLRVYHYINATDAGTGINYRAWLTKK